MARAYRPCDGVLLFDKPLGISSNTALQKVRRLFNAKKAGHTGTLDPLATGLLPICFGEATKFSNLLLNADKTYHALILLGTTTSTGDSEGEISAVHSVNIDLAEVNEALGKFRGNIQQLPPMHSALKHQGKPLYEYIRKGQTIERELRNIVIHELVLNNYCGNEIDITVRCSKGTYIRTLAEDIGAVLGCGAHPGGLRRTAIAHFDLEDAQDMPALEALSADERDGCILGIESLMPDMPTLQLDGMQVKRLAQGQRLALDVGLPDGKFRLLGDQGFIGLGQLQGHRLAPDRLLSTVAKQAAQPELKQNIGVE